MDCSKLSESRLVQNELTSLASGPGVESTIDCENTYLDFQSVADNTGDLDPAAMRMKTDGSTSFEPQVLLENSREQVKAICLYFGIPM